MSLPPLLLEWWQAPLSHFIKNTKALNLVMMTVMLKTRLNVRVMGMMIRMMKR